MVLVRTRIETGADRSLLWGVRQSLQVERAPRYLSAPILVGWGIAVLAAQQRLNAMWAALGLILVACLGGTGQVHVHHPAVAGALRHVSMGLTLAPGVQNSFFGLTHILVLLAIAGLPYLVWRLRKTPWRSA